eukprot:764187-Hanusia_phi.AAC.3
MDSSKEEEAWIARRRRRVYTLIVVRFVNSRIRLQAARGDVAKQPRWVRGAGELMGRGMSATDLKGRSRTKSAAGGGSRAPPRDLRRSDHRIIISGLPPSASWQVTEKQELHLGDKLHPRQEAQRPAGRCKEPRVNSRPTPHSPSRIVTAAGAVTAVGPATGAKQAFDFSPVCILLPLPASPSPHRIPLFLTLDQNQSLKEQVRVEVAGQGKVGEKIEGDEKR